MAITSPARSGPASEGFRSEILDRLPPHNLEAEQGVLGSLLLDPPLADEVATIVRPEDFYSEANGKIYEHMLAMQDAGQRIDTMLLVERLKKHGDLDAVGGTAHLHEIVGSVPVAAHAVHYARLVRDKATLRALIHSTTEILRDAYDPVLEPRELINQAEQKIFAVRDERSSDQITNSHDLMVDALKLIDLRMEHGGATGIPTGFVDLDNLTGGLHDGELTILAARPGMGKTALAINIADYVAVQSGVPALFVSLEMSRYELAQRLLSGRGRINGYKFRRGLLSSDDRQALMKASAELSRAALLIDDTPTRSMTEIAACARRLKRRENVGLVIIDYLQLIDPDDPRDPRQEQVAKIARRLKGMARELEIPVMCLAQLNRQADTGREGHRPRLSHLRESGAIEQDADVVMFVHREEYFHNPEENKDLQLKGKAQLIVAKQRNGPIGDVDLHWFEQYASFADASAEEDQDFEAYATSETDPF